MAQIETISSKEYDALKEVIEMLVGKYRQQTDEGIREKLADIYLKLKTEYVQNRDTEYLCNLITDHVTLRR